MTFATQVVISFCLVFCIHTATFSIGTYTFATQEHKIIFQDQIESGTCSFGVTHSNKYPNMFFFSYKNIVWASDYKYFHMITSIKAPSTTSEYCSLSQDYAVNGHTIEWISFSDPQQSKTLVTVDSSTVLQKLAYNSRRPLLWTQALQNGTNQVLTYNATSQETSILLSFDNSISRFTLDPKNPSSDYYFVLVNQEHVQMVNTRLHFEMTWIPKAKAPITAVLLQDYEFYWNEGNELYMCHTGTFTASVCASTKRKLLETTGIIQDLSISSDDTVIVYTQKSE